MGIVSGTVVFYSNLPFLLKLMNLLVFIPCILIQLENILNKTIMIKNIYLLPNNQIQILTVKNKNEILDLVTLKDARNDQRFPQKNEFNYELFIIFTSSNNKKLYHINKKGIYNKELLEYIINGNKLL